METQSNIHPSRETRICISMNIYKPNASFICYEAHKSASDILSAHWLTCNKLPAVSQDCLPAAPNSSPLNSVMKFYWPDRYPLIFQEQTDLIYLPLIPLFASAEENTHLHLT